MKKGLSIIGKAAAKRMSGEQPGVMQAVVAATVVGVASGVATYRLLRSGSD